MWKRITIAAAIATMLGLTACGGSESSSAGRKSMTVALASSWPGYGLIFLAKSEGLFAKEGLDVEIRQMDDKGQIAAAMASKRVDAWVTTVDTFVYFDAQKLDAVQVLPINFSDGGEGVGAKKSIGSVRDLKGKTIAAQAGSPSYLLLQLLLEDNGLSLNEVKLTEMTAPDAAAALIAGQVDAAATWEPWISKIRDGKDTHVLGTTREKPGVFADTMSVRGDFLKGDADAVGAFIRAYYAAYDAWESNKDAANATMAKELNLKVDEFGDQLETIRFVSRQDALKYMGTTQQPGAIFEVTAKDHDLYTQAGLISTTLDPRKVIDPDPINAALG